MNVFPLRFSPISLDTLRVTVMKVIRPSTLQPKHPCKRADTRSSRQSIYPSPEECFIGGRNPADFTSWGIGSLSHLHGFSLGQVVSLTSEPSTVPSHSYSLQTMSVVIYWGFIEKRLICPNLSPPVHDRSLPITLLMKMLTFFSWLHMDSQLTTPSRCTICSHFNTVPVSRVVDIVLHGLPKNWWKLSNYKS